MLHREVQGEALKGETDGPAIEPRNQEFGMPTQLRVKGFGRALAVCV
jgi:RNA-directed DNA polymerase